MGGTHRCIEDNRIAHKIQHEDLMARICFAEHGLEWKIVLKRMIRANLKMCTDFSVLCIVGEKIRLLHACVCVSFLWYISLCIVLR
jgi:hypothetical protein